MSTRACIKIKSRVFMTNEDYERGKATECVITLYHHSDGYPSGVGSDLKQFLATRNDGEQYGSKDVIWDAESIATDLVRGAICHKHWKTNDTYRDMGYVPAICQHGDCAYGYLIDCDNLTLTCYELGMDVFDWNEKNIVEIPDSEEEPVTMQGADIHVRYNVGDEFRWERYGKRHKTKVVAIDLYVATDKHGEPYQHAVYRTKAKEGGKVQTWYVNEEDVL